RQDLRLGRNQHDVVVGQSQSWFFIEHVFPSLGGGQGFEVRRSRFSEPRTLNFELWIAPFLHVSRFTHQGLWPLMPWTYLARSRSRPRPRRLPVAVHSPRPPACTVRPDCSRYRRQTRFL